MVSKSKLDLKAAYEATKKKSSLDELKITAGIPLSEEVKTSKKSEEQTTKEKTSPAESKLQTTNKNTKSKQTQNTQKKQDKKLGRPYADERSIGKTEKITAEITEQEAKAIRDYCYKNNVGKVTVIRDALDEFFKSKNYY